MLYGTIKNWNDDRGFGFILRDDGQPDIFAHIKFFATGVRPSEGLRVQFEIVTDARSGRPRADNVRSAQ